MHFLMVAFHDRFGRVGHYLTGQGRGGAGLSVFCVTRISIYLRSQKLVYSREDARNLSYLELTFWVRRKSAYYVQNIISLVFMIMFMGWGMCDAFVLWCSHRLSSHHRTVATLSHQRRSTIALVCQ